jgi:hypothetical protein
MVDSLVRTSSSFILGQFPQRINDGLAVVEELPVISTSLEDIRKHKARLQTRIEPPQKQIESEGIGQVGSSGEIFIGGMDLR